MVWLQRAPKRCILSFSLDFLASVCDGAGLAVMHASCWVSPELAMFYWTLNPIRSCLVLEREREEMVFPTSLRIRWRPPMLSAVCSFQRRWPCASDAVCRRAALPGRAIAVPLGMLLRNPACSLGSGSFWVPALYRGDCNLTFAGDIYIIASSVSSRRFALEVSQWIYIA